MPSVILVLACFSLLFLASGCDSQEDVAQSKNRVGRSRQNSSENTSNIGSSNNGSSNIGSGVTESEPARDRESSKEVPPKDIAGSDEADDVQSPETTRDSVETSLQRRLIQNPNDFQAIFQLAAIHADRDELSDAIGLLDQIPSEHPEVGTIAIGQAAQWCFEAGKYEAAERKYKQILERIPGAVPALRQLAFLFNRQGRRHEAAALIQQLCRQGNVLQDELHSLMMLNDAIFDPAPPQPLKRDTQISSTGNRKYYPIGPSGEARILATEIKYAEAAALLKPVIDGGEAPASVQAFYARLLIESQNDEAFLRHLHSADEDIKRFSEYWSAVGTFLLRNDEIDAAEQALLTAIAIDPTDRSSINRMAQLSRTRSDEKEGHRWDQYMKRIRQTVRHNNRLTSASSQAESLDEIASLSSELWDLNRRHESLLWRALAVSKYGVGSQSMQQLQQQRQAVIKEQTGFPTTQQAIIGHRLDEQREKMVAMAMQPHLAETEANPEGVASAKLKDQRRTSRQADSPQPRFANQAGQMGLDHTYRIAFEPQPNGFTVHQSVGGGVCVLDFDLDGLPDVYFAQGAATPPNLVGNQRNPMFRNLGDRFTEISEPASLSDFSYTIGVTAGDWNQDGFDDLFIGNLGEDSLWINNTDGTFRRVAFEAKSEVPTVPCSMAVADLDGDGLPELIQVNYLETTGIHKVAVHSVKPGLPVVYPFW